DRARVAGPGRRDLAARGARRGDRRRAARAVPRRSAASRPQLPRRAVALFAPPQLLLRMAALVRLRGARGRLTVGVAGVERTAADVPVPALHQRHSVHRGAGAAHARRGLPRLPAQHADAVSVVSQAFPRPEDGRMTTVALDTVELSAGRAAPGVLGLAERGLLPDALLRLGIRRMCAARLRAEQAGGRECAALRTATGVLRTLPRSAPEVFGLLLPARRRDAGRGGRRNAGAVR